MTSTAFDTISQNIVNPSASNLNLAILWVLYLFQIRFFGNGGIGDPCCAKSFSPRSMYTVCKKIKGRGESVTIVCYFWLLASEALFFIFSLCTCSILLKLLSGVEISDSFTNLTVILFLIVDVIALLFKMIISIAISKDIGAYNSATLGSVFA